MGTGELVETVDALLEWSWSIEEVINTSFFSSNFLNIILENKVLLCVSIVVSFLWVCALIWAIKDASARSSSFGFVLLSALIVILLTPIFGLPLYIAIRPQWWKRDKAPRRDISFKTIQTCENCWIINSISHLYCTNCWEPLHTTCRECGSKYSKSYSYCPHCGAPRLED